MFGFDFNDFAGAGGPRRGGGPPREKADTNKLYEVLGVAKDATGDQVKKAFRRQAMEHHPDKGGDSEKFKEIQKAYEILGDSEKRQIYDQYGEEAASNGGPGPSSSSDIFSELFGGGGARNRGPRKGEDTVFPLKVDLDSLYKGDTKKLKLTKRVICKTCDGRGGKSDSVQTCSGCKGRGVKVVIRQLGPGMIQQMQTTCPDCKGEGQVMNEKDKCKACKAEKTLPEEKILEVVIEKGMKHGDKVKFKGEGDQVPGIEPGDVICVLQQKEHSFFRREGPHLFMKKSISLLEALTGFKFAITHLDGRVLVVNSEKGAVYKPGDIKAIDNEGMPYPKQPFKRGLLFIELDVEFPKSNSLQENERKLLAKILPAPTTPPMDTDQLHDAEVVSLVDVDMKLEQEKLKEQERENRSSQAYDEDHEDAHARGPQCRAQ